MHEREIFQILQDGTDGQNVQTCCTTRMYTNTKTITYQYDCALAVQLNLICFLGSIKG